MKRKIILGLVALVAVFAGVASFSAWEAHVINVTAHIENALRILPFSKELVFGTVFPQEYREKTISITTSESFCETDQRRVTSIDYKIVQKPKCICVDETQIHCTLGEHAPVDYATHACPTAIDEESGATVYPYEKMTSLCPYLSKTPKQIDQDPYTDHGVLAFHDPEDPSSIATGTINKDFDVNDDWIIDLVVPCFKGYCSQDWPEFVASHNLDANPKDYEAEGDPNGTDFGCDLWVEVTDIY